MDSILQQILTYATDAHANQRRKFADEPYINHPVRVMHRCQKYTVDKSILAAALLHDVLEDTEITEQQLGSFLNSIMPDALAKHTLRLVVDLTDIFTHQAYPNLNRRKRKEKENERLSRAHPDAHTIKYADIIDNAMDIANSGDDFILKYLYECKALLKLLGKGDKQLFNEAKNTVSRNLEAFERNGSMGP